MDYALENLGPEKFQEICQALLAKSFPKTQCFPVGQKDGGRDAISFLPMPNSDRFIVFQVKFVRRPDLTQAPHKWLIGILKDEAPKLQALIPDGAREYYLITNVPGTAHPESGSIDTIQSILNEHLDVPAQCWWRDDVNRRLEDAIDIKWSYPDILSGPDILRFVIEHGLREDANRRANAIRTFLRDQFDQDNEVRFKQVELQNDLLDLFVDVPLVRQQSSSPKRERRFEANVIQFIMRECSRQTANSPEPSMLAAKFLLHPLSQKYFERAVIEGGPGQGKSTITQYVCQMHRRRLLNENAVDSRIPEEIRRHPVRLPFRVDCRDLAHWLSQGNPFSGDDVENAQVGQKRSLESFLAAMVHHHSGGSEFNVSDLQAVIKLSSTLLVFDGLDEVADLDARRQVVNEITKGVSRLREIAVSLQTVVTSRPAAFEGSPSFPANLFKYFSLTSIDQNLIEEYAKKWISARRLEGSDAKTVRRILKDKLDQPHLRELARNPMQLAILLSLIHTRGGSLPDKRTAMYDSYVELFLNRESEKSRIVRDHRELIANLHGYLAWILHSEAQTKSHRGSVNDAQLKLLVVDYLECEGHDPELAAMLFTGVVERFFALVSRVEGTYEFEVQPLREYFAARHLYNTAPYSPPGNPQNGTKPERFDALARDVFWHNVTRFYAGCYSKGELQSLVDRLEELAKAEGYRHTSYPLSLAATLLGDWVFAQDPKSMRQIVAMLLDRRALFQVAVSLDQGPRGEMLTLPERSGREELVDKCFELLKEGLPFDSAWTWVELIKANETRENCKSRWLEATLGCDGERRTRWLRYGQFLEVLPTLSSSESKAILADRIDEAERLVVLLDSGQSDFVEVSEARFKRVLEQLLWSETRPPRRRKGSVLSALRNALNPDMYAYAFETQHPIALRKVLSGCYLDPGVDVTKLGDSVKNRPELARKCFAVVLKSVELLERSAKEWATTIEPWSELVECAREQFGDCWMTFVLASTSAGIRSKDVKCDETSDFFDASAPLCMRARYARCRASVWSWWIEQMERADAQYDRAFLSLLAITWLGPAALRRIAQNLAGLIDSLDPDLWDVVSRELRWRRVYRKPIEMVGLSEYPERLSGRAVVFLSSRLDSVSSIALYRAHLIDYDGDDRAVLGHCQEMAIQEAVENPELWESALPRVASSYAKGVVGSFFLRHRFARVKDALGMPRSIAELIIEDCDLYPTELVHAAEVTCHSNVLAGAMPVGSIAETEGWFKN